MTQTSYRAKWKINLSIRSKFGFGSFFRIANKVETLSAGSVSIAARMKSS